jgi:hypothetical protein
MLKEEPTLELVLNVGPRCSESSVKNKGDAPFIFKGGSLVMAENQFEKKELGLEILNEWYEERDSLNQAQEKEASNLAPPVFVQSQQNILKKEEDKKSLIKKDIKYLLTLAEKNGLEYSIKEARGKNDPFLLDTYHDVLIKDGKYKKIIKK